MGFFFKELESIAIKLMLKKLLFIEYLDEPRQKLTDKLLQIIPAFSNNAIISKVSRIFLCNKKQWKSDKFFFLLIYSFTYFRQILIPKCDSIIQIFKNFCYVYQNILMKKQIFKAHKIYVSRSIFFYLPYLKKYICIPNVHSVYKLYICLFLGNAAADS